MPIPVQWLVSGLVAAVSILALTGCEEDVIAVTGTDYPYEVYGVLNPLADTQQVRVFPVEGALRPSAGSPIDAAVTSTDLETGQTVTWRDSLVAYTDGTYGYLFWAPFRPAEAHTYRLDVRRSDGVASSATVRVPVVPQILPPAVAGTQVVLPVRLGDPEAHLRRMEIEYRVTYSWCPGESEVFTMPHAHESGAEGAVQRVDARLDDDYRAIRDSLEGWNKFKEKYGVLPFRMTMRAVVTDGSWDPPGGVFDPEVLIEPGLMSNVQNGFGFVGSGYYWETDLRLPDEAVQAAGFITEERKPDMSEPSTCAGG